MRQELKRGVIELCVLMKLHTGERYGYEIYQELDIELGISESTIYPILRKLVNNKMCESYLKESSEGPPRKYFVLTKLGQLRYKDLRQEWGYFVGKINNILGGKQNEQVQVFKSAE